MVFTVAFPLWASRGGSKTFLWPGGNGHFVTVAWEKMRINMRINTNINATTNTNAIINLT